MEICFYYSQGERPQKAQLDEQTLLKQMKADSITFLGSGGFGETWAVNRNSKTTAVKIIYNPLYPRKRLAREIEGLQRADSPYVVKLLGTGDLTYAGQQHPFLEFEFVKGGSLASHINKSRWPSKQELNQHIIGLLSGLHELHDKEVIHRDIKPENIILRNGSFETPVIVDLGLAKITDTPTFTVYPSLLGTAPYMSPEQVRGEEAKKASDLWAVGVVSYILATGKHPFYGDFDHRLSLPEAHDRLMSGEVQLPQDVDSPLRETILRFLSPEPYQRGRTARALEELGGE